MRRFAALLVIALLPLFAFAASPSSTAGETKTQADTVAHGAEKESHGAAHPDQAQGGHHEGPKFLGLPAWIFKLINMALFLGVLFWLIGGPVKRALSARAAAIQRAADEARERREKADQVAGAIQARLAQLEEEVRGIRERAQHEGERQRRELIAAAEAEAAKMLANAQNEVENRIKNARRELTEYAGQLASDRAEQILRQNITDQDRQKIFRDSLREVEEVGS